MGDKVDFGALHMATLPHLERLLMSWLPGGSIKGHEYICAGIGGGRGKSMKISLEKGCGSDFATGDTWKDPTAIYAQVESVSMIEAARAVAEQINYDLGDQPAAIGSQRKPAYIHAPPPYVPDVAPEGADDPRFFYKPSDTYEGWIEPVSTWCYRREDGHPLIWVARFEYEEQGETMKAPIPYRWDNEKGKWKQGAWREGRPLMGLEDLAARPSKPVMIVEGEKCYDAARRLSGGAYNVVCWQGGGKAYSQTDFTPLFGRELLMWPDADQPGVEAMQGLAKELEPKCEKIRVLEVSGLDEGWDIADAEASGWNWEKVVAFAKPRAKEFSTAITAETTTPEVQAAGQHAAAVTININTEETWEVPHNISVAYERLGVGVNGAGVPDNNMSSVVAVLNGWPPLKGLCWFDKFHNKIMTDNDIEEGERPREWSDYDTISLLHYLQKVMGFKKATQTIVEDAIVFVARQRTTNEPLDWMNSLVWDQTNRLESFYSRYVGAEDNEYVQAVGRNFWIGLVARILSPGCQNDTMVYMIGPQGNGKTSACRIIGGPWYASMTAGAADKDFMVNLQGKMLIEIAELDAFNKSENTKIKSVITDTQDRFRAPYGRVAYDHPRMSSLIGTTNNYTPLRDDSGARRFLPVVTGIIDLASIERDREQLFAEAVHRFKQGEKWHVLPKELMAQVHDQHREIDEWESAIAEWLESPMTGHQVEVKMSDLAKDCLGVDVAKLDMRMQMRIAKILTQVGYKKSNLRREDSPGKWKQIKVWRLKEEVGK